MKRGFTVENLNAKDYEKIKESIYVFNSLNYKERKEKLSQINANWNDVFDEYAKLCEKDKEMTELQSFVKNYEKITRFNMRFFFRKYSHTINTFDYESSDRIYDYDDEEFLNHKHIYENIETIRETINNKIEKIEKTRFVFRKKAKVEKLKDELKNNEKISRRFANLKEKENLKNDYLENKTEQYNSCKKRFKELSRQYADKVVYSALKKTPSLASVAHNNQMSNGYYIVDSLALNDSCNTVRSCVLEIIANEEKTQPTKNCEQKVRES